SSLHPGKFSLRGELGPQPALICTKLAPSNGALETVSAALEPPRAADYLAWAERNISFDEGAFSRPVHSRWPFRRCRTASALGPAGPLPLRIKVHIGCRSPPLV